MVVAVAGDVKAEQVMPILEKYFGRLPMSHKPDETTTTEPPQNSERKVELKEKTQPLYLEGYHRPDYRTKDDAVFDAITDLHVGRPHLSPLSRLGARQEDRIVLRRIHRTARH
jgi:predicted Zn-dependent peptidase